MNPQDSQIHSCAVSVLMGPQPSASSRSLPGGVREASEGALVSRAMEPVRAARGRERDPAARRRRRARGAARPPQPGRALHARRVGVPGRRGRRRATAGCASPRCASWSRRPGSSWPARRRSSRGRAGSRRAISRSASTRTSSSRRPRPAPTRARTARSSSTWAGSPPAAALDAHARGELELMFPTVVHLRGAGGLRDGRRRPGRRRAGRVIAPVEPELRDGRLVLP